MNISANNDIDFISKFSDTVRSVYSIDESLYNNPNIKRGLRNSDGTGIIIGVTGIGSVQGYYIEDCERVPMEGELYYRGINALDIIKSHREHNTFGYEEVAYLLLLGHLPTEEQFEYFNSVLSKSHPLPAGFIEDVLLKAPSSNIMNQLSRAVLALYSYDSNPDDTSAENLLRQSIELIARFPAIVANAYAAKRHYFENKSLYIHMPKENLSVAENFLRMARTDKIYTDEEAKLLDMMLMLHAEHGGGNNSSFVCRAISSSGTDTYSAIAAAVDSLKGPLHGGANSKVREMLGYVKENVRNPKDDDELRAYLSKLLDGSEGDHSGKLYGLGHAVYTISDPRALTIKKYATDLAASHNCLDELELIESVERIGIELITKRKHLKLPICANVDLYSGFVYSMLGIPEELYTPLFATARVAGWCAHRMEEILSCKRIMRPAFKAAIKKVPYVEMDNRK